jgi:hypothetical protein
MLLAQGPTCQCNPGYTGDGYLCTLPDACSRESVVFTKPSYADYTDPVYQDCITPDVCLTRGHNRPLYNAATSTLAAQTCEGPDPIGTLWALGPCGSVPLSQFGPFISWSFADCSPPWIVGQPGCLVLSNSGLAFDITFTHWAQGDTGGGFSYTRTPVACDVLDAQCVPVDENPVCFCPPEYEPNPSTGRCRRTDCPPGFEHSPFTGHCQDIDECAVGAHQCDPTALCENSVGSYACLCSRVIFQKHDYADPTLPENQDCITPNVCITRNDYEPLYNAVREQYAEATCDGRTPTDTEWAQVPCASAQPWDFGYFTGDFANCEPPSMVGMPGCLHLISDDLYFDIVFTHWTSGGNGGGFAYQRTAVVAPAQACP